jgi:hypothetical protein
MSGKLEHMVEKYFKMVNPLPYGDIKVFMKDPMGICFITIYVSRYEMSWKYYGRKGKDYTMLEQIRQDMEYMFPYCFKISCEVIEYKINPYIK